MTMTRASAPILRSSLDPARKSIEGRLKILQAGKSPLRREVVRFAFLLAWRIATHQPSRLLVSLSGLGFAVLLMLAQLGFRNALLDSSVELLEQLDADVVILAADKRSMSERSPISRQRLTQSLSNPDVLAAYPFYLAILPFRNLDDDTLRPIRVLGFDPRTPAWRSAELDGLRGLLGPPDTMLVDRRSRKYYGRITPGPAQVGKRIMTIVGNFTLATDFETDGNMVVSDQTFFRLTAGDPGPGTVEMVLVRARPGADPSALAKALSAQLPSDVIALSRSELRARELEFWRSATPVSVVFGLGMAVGFLVGVVICYQILYTDVTDHLKEFATLEAIGYGARFVVAVVLSEALILSLIALVPSIGAGVGLYAAIGELTGLLLRLTWERAGMIAVLTVGMCVLAGLLAVRKVLSADPADVF